MKHLLFLIIATVFIFTNGLFAQAPEKIYGKNKLLKPNAYYLQQMEQYLTNTIHTSLKDKTTFFSSDIF